MHCLIVFKKTFKRYTKLLEQDRIKDETLFYNDMFESNGKTYKFTGAFAPINQITGLMTF